MICSHCGFDIINDLNKEGRTLIVCKECYMIFCSECINEAGKQCLNDDCKSKNLSELDADLNYFFFEQDWRHIKKGGFG